MDRPTLHVLLLEDQLDWAAFLRRLLDAVEDVRFVLTHAASLAELCAKLERGTFDAILLDLCVEDSEGLDTFRRAKAAAPDVPIVVQSGLQGSDVAVAAVGLGAQDYILKDEVTARSLSRALLYAVERRRYQEALRVSEERYSLAMRAANAGLWDWDMKKGELHVSARWLTQLGLDGEDGRTLGPDVWATALVEEDRAAFGEAIKAHLEGRTDHFEVEYRIHTAAGTRWCLCRGLAMRDASGQPTRMAGSQSDITRQKRAEERLRHDALHDALTGLPNRTLFRDRLEHALHRIRRDPRKGFAVLFVDLDRFKMVNDSLGHAAGDELLRGVARRLTGLLRPGDTVARLGGDEFAVLLEDASATHDAEITAERLVEALSRPFDVESGEVIVGASVGISHSHAAYLRPEEMLRNADTALYHAKRRGGGHISMFEPQLHAQASERLSLEMDLRRALENDELLLSFQPIVSLADQEIQGFEALLRWNSPTRAWSAPMRSSRWPRTPASSSASATGSCGRPAPA
jgi:diguanylate cyclase (GGDEF)-like protein/PAS domain S-box-containing protein